MLSLWRRLWEVPGWLRVLLVGQVINSAGGLAWLYLALYLVSERNLTPARAGLVSAGYGVGLIAGNFGGGFIGDRFGVRRTLLASRIGWVGLCLLIPVAPIAVLPALVVVAGLVSGAARPLTFALIAGALPAARRRENMALLRTASNLGFTIGPPIGAVLATRAFGAVFVVDAVSTAVLAVVVAVFVPRDGQFTRDPSGSDGVWRSLRAAPAVVAVLVTVLVVDTVYRQLLTPLPLLLRDLGHSPVAFGVLMAVNAAIIVVFEAPVAVLLARRSALGVIAAGYLLVGLGLLAIAGHPSLAAAAVAVVVITGGEMLYKPTATAQVADAAPPGLGARYQSLYAGASIGGMMLAPALGGFGYQHAPRLLWPVAGGAAVVCALLLWRRRSPNPAVVESAPAAIGT